MLKFNNYKVVENVILSRKAMVLDHNYNLIEDASLLFNYWHNWQINNGQKNILQKEEMAKLAKDRPVVQLPEDTYILATTFGNHHNFSHLWDILQTLRFVEDIEGTLIHNEITSQVNEFFTHLDVMGYGPEKRMAVDVFENVYRVPKLIVPPLACEPNHVKFHDWLSGKYHKAFKDTHPPCRLYLSRGSFKRQLENEEEVQKFVKELGFIILDGSEPLSDHVKLFRSAKTIAGYHGSLFKNILFCQNDPEIIEFCPHNRHDLCFWKQAMDCGITKKYTFIVVDADENHNATLRQKHLSLLEHVSST
jgi:capsular polysaccharide biosynthesis protein